ncbi:MAG: hypothetical protein RSB74_04355 [Kiritimatiellia bacterium]
MKIKVAFILLHESLFYGRAVWERMCEDNRFEVTLIVTLGCSWSEPPHPHRKIVRMVADCAGNAELPPPETFHLVILSERMPKDFAYSTENLSALGVHFLFVRK